MSRFNIPGLLGAIGELPSVINRGLLGPMPVNPQLGLDPTQVKGAQDSALNDFAFGMMAAGQGPRNNPMGGLYMARQQARENFSGRMVEILREQEFVRLKGEREEVKKQQANIASIDVDGMEGIWSNLSPQAREQIIIEKATAKTAANEPPNSYQEFMLAGGQQIKDPVERAKAYDSWLLRKAEASGTKVNVGLPSGVDPKQASQAAIDRLAAAHKSGMGAAGRISTANNIRAFLDEGALAGFGSSVGLTLARAGSLVSESAEGLAAKTEALRASLADATLWAYERLKGTGQVTEKEMELLQKASAGDPAITKQAMYQVADLIERAGKLDIDQSRAVTEALLSDETLRPLASAFEIRSPDPYAKSVKLDDGRMIEAKRGSDGKYYYTDPKTKKRYRVEE